jgi:hypothetical protein
LGPSPFAAPPAPELFEVFTAPPPAVTTAAPAGVTAVGEGPGHPPVIPAVVVPTPALLEAVLEPASLARPEGVSIDFGLQVALVFSPVQAALASPTIASPTRATAFRRTPFVRFMLASPIASRECHHVPT